MLKKGAGRHKNGLPTLAIRCAQVAATGKGASLRAGQGTPYASIKQGAGANAGWPVYHQLNHQEAIPDEALGQGNSNQASPNLSPLQPASLPRHAKKPRRPPVTSPFSEPDDTNHAQSISDQASAAAKASRQPQAASEHTIDIPEDQPFDHEQKDCLTQPLRDGEQGSSISSVRQKSLSTRMGRNMLGMMLSGTISYQAADNPWV